jgi:hypothetical protein
LEWPITRRQFQPHQTKIKNLQNFVKISQNFMKFHKIWNFQIFKISFEIPGQKPYTGLRPCKPLLSPFEPIRALDRCGDCTIQRSVKQIENQSKTSKNGCFQSSFTSTSRPGPFYRA